MRSASAIYDKQFGWPALQRWFVRSVRWKRTIYHPVDLWWFWYGDVRICCMVPKRWLKSADLNSSYSNCHRPRTVMSMISNADCRASGTVLSLPTKCVWRFSVPYIWTETETKFVGGRLSVDDLFCLDSVNMYSRWYERPVPLVIHSYNIIVSRVSRRPENIRWEGSLRHRTRCILFVRREITFS